MAGVLVECSHLPGAHLPPELMARLMAFVSSDVPSPARWQCQGLYVDSVRMLHTLCTEVFNITKDLVAGVCVERGNALVLDLF